ncbi:radical SAM protein [Haliscomenobacter sp.]|uniref:B12-binding domain-containing radical SAM protein n=1 Tax=Haliscomenobacter sp. TaxID=2717303 RepID=UPI003364DCDC
MSDKILVVSIPRLEPHRPPISAAIVATVCENHGHQVEAVDLNIKFYHYCKDQEINYYSFDSVWDKYRLPTQQELDFVDNFIIKFQTDYNLSSYKYIMLSVFGMSNHFFADRLLAKIGPNRPFKILVGGSGAFTSIKGNTLESFVGYFKRVNLIDDYIKGECEETLPLYLDGLNGKGINNLDPAQIENLDTLPLLDYKHFDLDAYDYIEKVRDIYIEGSRGCVRKCTYCDVASFWPKYRFRSGEHIAREIIHNYEYHGVQKFYFTDSLVNGSLKSFSNMCEILTNYQFADQIKWGGQFIFRNKKTVSPEHFEMISKAGGGTFYVGIETGSDRIRQEMGKNFTNDDIEYQLEQFQKNKLHCTFLMFPGYVTETLQDHQETLAMLPRWKKYVASGTINGLELGQPLLILEETPLSRMIDTYKIKFVDSQEIAINGLWRSEINPDLDFVERVKRQLEIYEHAAEHKWPIWRFTSRVIALKNLLESFYSIQDVSPGYKTIMMKTL